MNVQRCEARSLRRHLRRLCQGGVRLAGAAVFGVAGLLAGGGAAQATGMVPETSVVLLLEADGETTMNVRNSEATPQLLYSSVNHIDEDQEDLVVVTPPVARVEGNETQVVRFLLRSKTPLRTERLARAVFEGIPPRVVKPGGARVTMTVRQDLPLVIHPRDLPLEREPWRLLKIAVEGTALVVENPSPYVVRLAQSVALQPGGMTVELPRPYILPETTVKVSLDGVRKGRRNATPDVTPDAASDEPPDALPDVPHQAPLGETLAAVKAVRLFPATLYGFAVDSYDAPLARAETAR